MEFDLKSLCQYIIDSIESGERSGKEITMWRERFLYEFLPKESSEKRILAECVFLSTPTHVMMKQNPEDYLYELYHGVKP